MKKVIPLILMSLCCLTGCFLSKKEETHSQVSSSYRDSSRSSTESSSSTEESQEVVTRTFLGEVHGTSRQDTITYQGKKILQLKLDLTGSLPENIQSSAENLSLEDLRRLFQEGVEKNETYQAISSMEGVAVAYTITDEKKLRAEIDLDIAKIDTAKLKTLPLFTDIPLDEIQSMSPVTYIAGLKVLGLHEVKEAPQEEGQ
ncbi:SP0191 family lipoprotein [Streptococcus pneumoniae]